MFFIVDTVHVQHILLFTYISALQPSSWKQLTYNMRYLQKPQTLQDATQRESFAYLPPNICIQIKIATKGENHGNYHSLSIYVFSQGVHGHSF